jgi:hypothetical protein
MQVKPIRRLFNEQWQRELAAAHIAANKTTYDKRQADGILFESLPLKEKKSCRLQKKV